MKKNDLKPCPFCAGKATMLIVPGEKSKWLVKCQNGCCNQMPHDSEEEAAEEWNRRTEVNNQSPEINNSNDCISRQGAIDHFKSITVATSIGNKYNEGFVDGLDFAVEHLKTMPSVQPEPLSDAYIL